MRIAATLLLVAALAGSWQAGQARAQSIAGRASVIDADTIDIHGVRIRLLDIDAPESDQTCTRDDGAKWRCGQQAALRLDVTQRPVSRFGLSFGSPAQPLHARV